MKRFIFLSLGIGLFIFPTSVGAQDGAPQVRLSRTGDSQEMAQYVHAAIEEMMGGLKNVSKLGDAARRNGDEEMIRCVSVRLGNIRALLMVSERASGAMKEANSSGRLDRAEHEFRKVVVSLAKVRHFTAEAESCMGEAGATPGTSAVQVSQSGLTEGDDSESLDDYFFVVGVDPPRVSPFE